MQILMFILIIIGAVTIAIAMNNLIDRIYDEFLWKKLMKKLEEEEEHV